MFEHDSKMKKILEKVTYGCYAAGLLGILAAVFATPFGGAVALLGWVFGGLLGIVLLGFAYWLSAQLAPQDDAPIELPAELTEQCRKDAHKAWLFFGGAALAFSIAVLSLLIQGPQSILGIGGLTISVIAATLASVLVWNRAYIKGRYRRLQREALVSWTRFGQTVYISRDAAYCDGVLLEWNGYSNILREAVWSNGTIEFSVDRYNPKTGYMGTDTLQIPVPMEHEEQAQEALHVIRTAPLSGTSILLLVLQVSVGIAALFMIAGLLIARLLPS